MIWAKKEIQPQVIRELSARYSCEILTASILARRSIMEGEDILFFLEDDPRYLHNPFLFDRMEDAVDRILAAKEEGEKILIFGDRDVDGISSTVILYQMLTGMGIEVSWRVPAGNDPYGLTMEAVDEFAANYGSLIITVDCGISNFAEISHASEKGIDVIVIDHHNPQEEIPEEAIIVNPKMEDSGYPFRGLAGCGVVYKLTTALRFSATELYKQEVCLLNVRPVNGAYVIEALKVMNMAETERIAETIIPGMVSISQTRLLPFLQGQQIFVWDEPMQRKQLVKIFGAGVEFNLMDMQPEISGLIPAVRDFSLLKVKDLSRIVRYQDSPAGELDGFFNIFVTYVQKKTAAFSPQDAKELQLVALGTLADLMPLSNENRILIRQGLASINAGARPGLLELLSRQNLLGKRIGTGDLAWHISPVVNAAGRLGKPQLAVQLLLEEDPAERSRLADEIIDMNKSRRQMGSDAWSLIEGPARKSLEETENKLVFVADERVHRGITGYMASKLVQCFKAPSLVITFLDEEHGVGSMRSTRGYDVRSLLSQCADLLTDYGGHNFAAGFSFKRSNFDELKERVKTLVPLIEFTEAAGEEHLDIDAELPHKYLTPSLLKLVDTFEPYGDTNGPLVFMAKDLKIISADIMGKTEKQHLKLTLDCGSFKWPAIFWQASERLKRDFDTGDKIDIVFQISRNMFNGAETAQMTLLDARKQV